MVLGGTIDNSSFSFVNFDSADDLNPLNARALGDNKISQGLNTKGGFWKMWWRVL